MSTLRDIDTARKTLFEAAALADRGMRLRETANRHHDAYLKQIAVLTMHQALRNSFEVHAQLADHPASSGDDSFMALAVMATHLLEIHGQETLLYDVNRTRNAIAHPDLKDTHLPIDAPKACEQLTAFLDTFGDRLFTANTQQQTVKPSELIRGYFTRQSASAQAAAQHVHQSLFRKPHKPNARLVPNSAYPQKGWSENPAPVNALAGCLPCPIVIVCAVIVLVAGLLR